VEAPLNARAALLQALYAGPGYGLDLIGRLEEMSGGAVCLAMGSVYPTLRQLERDGLARAWEGPARRRGGRPRRYYELTPKGVKVARGLRESLLGLVRSDREPAPTPLVVAQMQERLLRCDEVSALGAELRNLGRGLAKP
jgi:PadR family transcriptional regulator PadR